jgi:carbon monoxide dehydrogenase subunit G
MQLGFQVSQAPEFVHHCLTDPIRFVNVHPVITSLEPTGDNSYIVSETLKVGFIPISFKYRASFYFQQDDKRQVQIEAVVAGFTRIAMQLELQGNDKGTRIDETIKITSFLPIGPVLHSIFRKQHKRLFQNIESAVQ